MTSEDSKHTAQGLMTRGTVCRHDIVYVFAGMTMTRDFIAVGTENDMTVLKGVVCKCAGYLTTTLADKKVSVP